MTVFGYIEGSFLVSRTGDARERHVPPYYCKVVVGLGTQFCTLSEVWVLGVGMSTLGAQTSLYAEDRGIQVPMTLEHVFTREIV